MIFHPAKDNNTNISVALEHIHKVIKRKSIIFLISDFWDKSFHRSMKLINNKHDLINIHILDKAEETIPDLGFIKIHDVESQETAWVETNKSKIQDIISRKTQSINKSFYNFCKLNRIDIISINTGKDYIKPLEEFFNNRIKRY